jgi:hypothetical protein
MSNGTRTQVSTMLMLKRSYQLVSAAKGDKSELRDNARNNMVVFSGTYKQCVAEAKRRGVWYS